MCSTGRPPIRGLPAALARARTLLVTAPPDRQGDPALRLFSREIAEAPDLQRIVYLSTVGVYGDAGGDWVDETRPTLAASPRTKARLESEAGVARSPRLGGARRARRRAEARRHLRTWPQSAGEGARGFGSADHQARAGVQPHSRR